MSVSIFLISQIDHGIESKRIALKDYALLPITGDIAPPYTHYFYAHN